MDSHGTTQSEVRTGQKKKKTDQVVKGKLWVKYCFIVKTGIVLEMRIQITFLLAVAHGIIFQILSLFIADF